MKKRKAYYMHTIDGSPAFFSERSGQICYMNFYGKPPKLAKSLKQIRREQELTREFRVRNNLKFDYAFFSYRRVSV